jgi:acyl-CoA thioester hydrolase
MASLTLFDQSQVDESEIDSLGHMNVRFYGLRAARANLELLKRVGIHRAPSSGQILRRVDTYSRFHREQFAGATLSTSGGLVDGERVDGMEGIGAYFEIRNVGNDELAASFILTSSLIEAATQTVLKLPEASSLEDSPYKIHVPAHGAPRSLSIAPPRIVPLPELEQAVTDDPAAGLMSGRREGLVLSEDCDEHGRLRENVDLMFVIHHPRSNVGNASLGPPLLKDTHGRRYSWAMMETRSVQWRRPQADDTVVSIGADIAFSKLWRQTRRWMFVKDTGLPLGISDTVGICIDLDARRAIPIPDEDREVIERTSLPQFA